MLIYPRMWFAPDGPSGGASDNEPTLEQLQQQVREIQAKYDLLNTRVEKGELVEPKIWLESEIKAGNIFQKERYTGLQQTFQAEQESHKKTKETLTNLTSSDMDLKQKFSNLENEKSTLQSKLDEDTATIETLTRDKKRATVIMEKFPELASFEAKGLLPEGGEDELETLFSAFSDQLGAIRTKAEQDFGTGGGKTTPSSKDGQQPPSSSGSKTYLSLANSELAKGNVEGYNDNYDKYLKALQGEKVS